MVRSADKTDSYISMVLGLNGRVRPADLQSVPQEARPEALRTFAEKHHAEMQLYFDGEELVAGSRPSATATESDVADEASLGGDPQSAASTASEPLPSTPAPADLTADGKSAIDLLLGDYDGVPEAAAAPDVATPGIRPAASGGLEIQPGLAALTPVAPLAVSAMPGGPTPATAPEPSGDTSRRWMLWWIPTLLLPVIGGAVAWLALRRTRAVAARAMLTTALVLGLLVSVTWLRYAEQIAAVAEQRAADKVIVLPTK